MSTYYEKRLATELPKEEGQYLTDLGVLSFRNFKELTPEQGKVFSFNQHTEKFTALEEGWFDSDVILVYPNWWLYPLPSPIPSMTLEECKDKAAKHFGYKNYNEAEVLHVGSPLIDMQAEIIQLSAYALSLKQEVEELKEKLKQSEYNLLVVSETAVQLEQQVKTLQHSLERVHNYYEPESTITPEDAILAIEDIARMALKETGYDIF